MNWKLFRIIVLVLFLLVLAGLDNDRFGFVLAQAKQSNYIVEYPIEVSPLNISVESAGHVWFTAPNSNLIGSLIVTSTTEFRVQKFPVPTAASKPYDLVYKNGIVWFTEQAGNRIGKLDVATGAIQEFVIPTANSAPKGIGVAADGTVWFVESNGNQLGRLDPSNGAFTEFLYATPNAQMEDLAIQADGNVWITAPALDRVIFFRILRGDFLIVPTGTASKPLGIALDEQNQLWTAIQQPGAVGRYAPGTLALWRWFQSPTPNSKASGITVHTSDTHTSIWYTAPATNQVGIVELTPSASLLSHLESPLPTAGGLPWGIATDDQANVWIAASGTNLIARWSVPYFTSTYLPIIVR